MRYFLLAVFALIACQTIRNPYPEPLLKEDEFAIVISGRQGISCFSGEKVACGINLWDCADGLRYYCAQTVSVFSLSGFKEASKSYIQQ